MHIFINLRKLCHCCTVHELHTDVRCHKHNVTVQAPEPDEDPGPGDPPDPVAAEPEPGPSTARSPRSSPSRKRKSSSPGDGEENKRKCDRKGNFRASFQTKWDKKVIMLACLDPLILMPHLIIMKQSWLTTRVLFLAISAMKSPSPKKNQGTDDAGSDSDGDEGAYCNICMEPWTNSGVHRISSLRFFKINLCQFQLAS